MGRVPFFGSVRGIYKGLLGRLKKPPLPEELPRPRIGLALGGGLSWSYAHIGVLEVIEKLGISVDVVAGTSGGSLVAALWCGGMKAADAAKAALEFGWRDVFKIHLLPRMGLASDVRLAKFLVSHIGDVQFEDLKIPLRIVATDLATGEKHVFKTGSVAQAMRASCAIPGIFDPVEIEGRKYADGGLLEKVPARTLREERVETVISVCFPTKGAPAEVNNVFDVLARCFDVALERQEDEVRMLSNIVISPDVRGLNRMDFGNSNTMELMERGRGAASLVLTELSSLK